MALKQQIPWRNLRRPSQVPPDGDWLTWLILTGRGWGKTRVGAEWVLENSTFYRRFLLAGRTSGDLRDIMIEGESGILSIAPSGQMPNYEPSKRRLTFASGAVAVLRTADEPEGFRGLQAEAVWADELAAWEHEEAWDQLQFGFRLGHRPRQIVTTTPKPRPFVLELLRDLGTVVTRGSTYENRANLAPKFLRDVVRRYEGTRLGRQELHGEILTDVPGALWRREMIRYDNPPVHGVAGELKPYYLRVLVSIDPAVTYGPDSDETGIVAAAKAADGRGYVLDDQSGRMSPRDWAQRAIALHDETGADAIVGEVNNGGELVEANLRSVGFKGRFIAVHASRGKRVRAEPISALYEQSKVSHLRAFAEMEDQMCNFTPDSVTSPDRMDALVWALTELMLGTAYSGEPSTFSEVA